MGSSFLNGAFHLLLILVDLFVDFKCILTAFY